MKGLANLSPHVHGTVILDVNVNHFETNYWQQPHNIYCIFVCNYCRHSVSLSYGYLPPLAGAAGNFFACESSSSDSPSSR